MPSFAASRDEVMLEVASVGWTRSDKKCLSSRGWEIVTIGDQPCQLPL